MTFRANLRLLAFAMVFLFAAASSPMAGETPQPPSPHLVVGATPAHPGVLVMQWRGPIQAPMSAEIEEAFERHKSNTNLFVLRLDSGGGSVAEGERVIAVLDKIKKTHKLNSSVGPGRRCGSMCVFIYVQGQRRFGAPASLWLFHEVSFADPVTKKTVRLDRKSWERLIEKYWIPAGVSRGWIETTKSHTAGKDYWVAGEHLLRDGSNIILMALPDEQRRIIYRKS